jgi:hypothetical protein
VASYQIKHGSAQNVAPFPAWRRAAHALSQGEVASTDVSVKLVFAVAALLEGAEEAAMVFAKWGGVDVSRCDRRFHMRIVRRIADAHNELAGVKLNLFVTGDVA